MRNYEKEIDRQGDRNRTIEKERIYEFVRDESRKSLDIIFVSVKRKKYALDREKEMEIEKDSNSGKNISFKETGE